MQAMPAPISLPMACAASSSMLSLLGVCRLSG
jgi:hypothetical protein